MERLMMIAKMMEKYKKVRIKKRLESAFNKGF